MKGILLAGGNGRRLNPLTDITNKHLLAVYDRPMILYPLQSLVDAGIDEVLIITGKEYAGGFLKLLGSGKDYGCRIWYEIQEEAGGIAQALGLGEKFVENENVAVILGDNIFEDPFKPFVEEFEGQQGARVFLKKAPDASRFGVPVFKDEKIIKIEEKPEKPQSDYAVTGFYMYDSKVFQVIKDLKPSARGELEITDVNNYYIENGLLKPHFVEGSWTDAGTFESLYRANRIARHINMSRAGLNAEEIKKRDEELMW